MNSSTTRENSISNNEDDLKDNDPQIARQNCLEYFANMIIEEYLYEKRKQVHGDNILPSIH